MDDQNKAVESVKKFNLRSSLAWVFGLILLISGVTSITERPIAGIFLIISSMLILPPVVKFISDKWNIHMSSNLRVVLAVILLVSGFSITGRSAVQNSQTTQSTQEQNSRSEGVVQESEKTYQEVFSFSGSGAKKSEPFIITGSRFKIAYNCDGSLCQAFLYKVGSDLMSDLIINDSGPVKDETIIYRSGEYYIQSNTIGTYTMTVYDYK